MTTLVFVGVSCVLWLITQVLGVPAVAAEVYYVSPTGNDASSGTESAPWKTIGKAAATAAAGDTAVLMDGTFTEPEIVFRTSGTATRPITVRAQNKHQAILSSTSGCNPNISIHASYVTVQDIRSIISPNNVTCVTGVNSASGTAVRCWQSNLATVSRPTTGNAGCTVRGVLVDASPARGHAIKTNQDFSVVEDSTVYSGIEALNSYGTVFRNNTVIGGDAFGASIVSKGGVRNFQAYNNVVYVQSVSGEGIILGGITETPFLYDQASGFEAYNSVAYNNVVINQSGGSTDALGMIAAVDSALFNNVVIEGTLVLRSASVDSANPMIKNNIFMCSGRNAVRQFTYSGLLSLDHNNFHNCLNGPPQATPIIGDPMFVDDRSDWRLTSGSPARQRGTPIRATGFMGETLVVNKGKDGKVRSTPWDLGVHVMRDSTAEPTPPPPPTNIRVS